MKNPPKIYKRKISCLEIKGLIGWRQGKAIVIRSVNG